MHQHVSNDSTKREMKSPKEKVQNWGEKLVVRVGSAVLDKAPGHYSTLSHQVKKKSVQGREQEQPQK